MCREVDDFRYLRHTVVDARQGIGFVVDDDQYLQLIELRHIVGRRALGHVSLPVSGNNRPRRRRVTISAPSRRLDP